MPKKGNAEEKEQKKPLGRPTTYKPEYCEEIIKLTSQGLGIPQIASKWGVAKQSIFDWAERNPEFSDALTRAYTTVEAYWTDLAEVVATPCAEEYSYATGGDSYTVAKRINHNLMDKIVRYRLLAREEQEQRTLRRAELQQKIELNAIALEEARLRVELMRKQLHEGAPPRDTIELQEGILEGVNKIADRLIEKEVASK